MIWYTIEQAAERVGRHPSTIRAWIASGRLPVIHHDLVPGVRFVAEDALLAAFAAARQAHGGPTRFGTNSAGQHGNACYSPDRRSSAPTEPETGAPDPP